MNIENHHFTDTFTDKSLHTLLSMRFCDDVNTHTHTYFVVTQEGTAFEERRSPADRMRLQQILSESNLSDNAPPPPRYDITSSSYAPPTASDIRSYTGRGRVSRGYERVSASRGSVRGGATAGAVGRSKKIRLDTEGRERGRRKVSNRG